MTTFEIVRDLILLGLGGLGAGLSVFNFLDARKKDARSVGVKIDTAIPVDHFGNMGLNYVKVSGTNLGTRDVTISSLGIATPGGGSLASLHANPMPGVQDTALPKRLSDGDSAFCHYAYADIGKALHDRYGSGKVRVVPYADDTSGKRHLGEAFEIDPAEFARM